jgi:cytochrome c553
MTSRLLLVSAFAVIGLLALVALTLFLVRQSGGQERPQNMAEGDASEAPDRESRYIDLGRAVVVGATGHSIEHACRACHGMDGAGDGSGAFPRLSELPEWYIYKQLRDYASEARPNDVMTPIAQALNEGEMRGAARYYANQNAGFPARPDAAPLALQIGGALAAVGDAGRGITACASCHGRLGDGAPPVTPPLAGQYAAYTSLQLDLFRRGVRRNDVAEVMREVAAPLTDAEIAALGHYFESIRTPLETTTADAPQ